MSDNENIAGGSPIDRSKRPRFDAGDWDSDYEGDGHDDRHPKRLAVPDPETKAPHFVPTEDNNTATNNSNVEKAPNTNSRRKKWEEKSDSEDEPIVAKPRPSSAKETDNNEKNNNSNENAPAAAATGTKEGAVTPTDSISLRSLVGTKDAGVIIGRGGKNVSDIRALSNARVTISEIVPGAFERILTVSGPVDAVAKAYSLVGEKILSEHTQPDERNSDGERLLVIKLLVPDGKMGTLIGKGGSVIKSIQDESKARLNASEEPLPMSTEREVTIQGTPAAVQHAVQRIGKILVEYSSTNVSTIQYRPTPQMHGGSSRSSNGGNMNNNYMGMRGNNTAAAMGYGGMMPMGGMPMNNANQFYYHQAGPNGGGGNYGMPNSRQADYGMGAMGMNPMSMGAMGMGVMGPSQAQQIFIPNEMVGCIIGKGGSKINEIRQLSGSHIKIADSQGEASERLVTITGTPESNQMALYLLYSRLESEKNRMGLRQP